MNKFTRHILKTSNKKEAMFYSCIAGIRYKERFDKITEKSNEEHAFLSICKYLIRESVYVDDKNKKTLSSYNIEDSLEVNEMLIFCGQFSFDIKEGGYVPMYFTQKKTKLLTDYFQSQNEKQISKVWNIAKDYLSSESGHSPILIDINDDKHLYFIENSEKNEVKIGISNYPEIRRKQIQKDFKTRLNIIHIIPAGGKKLEKILHEHFFRQRKQGEWFHFSDEIKEFINYSKDRSLDEVFDKLE